MKVGKESDKKLLTEQLKKTVKREQSRNYVVLYTVTAIIFIIVLWYSFAQGYSTKETFFIELLNGMIGILPPILIFDFFHEKLSREASAVDMSNKITEALISNPEILELFTEEQRQTFLESTIHSIVKNDLVTEMIIKNLENYLSLEQVGRVRTEFCYDIQLDEKLPDLYNEFVGKNDYFYVQEKLHYRVKYLHEKGNNTNTNEIHIGFLYENQKLDNTLRGKNKDSDFDKCIFRECLDIKQQDRDFLKGLSQNREERICKFQSLFRMDLQIDMFKATISDVLVKEEGIIVKMHVDHDIHASEHSVRIIFHLPKRWGSILEVTLVDPTKAPKISVSYPEDAMDVDMFPFLSKGEESSVEVAHEHMNGIYDISLHNEWIYPISGLAFTVNKK